MNGFVSERQTDRCRAIASDSDNSLQPLTNRGNKLKRKAQFVQKGQLDIPSGPKVYKRVSFPNSNWRHGSIRCRKSSMLAMKDTLLAEILDAMMKMATSSMMMNRMKKRMLTLRLVMHTKKFA